MASSSAAKKILDEALRLPARQRARIARVLEASVDDQESPAATDIERAWAREAERRLERLRTGATRLVLRAELRARTAEVVKASRRR